MSGDAPTSLCALGCGLCLVCVRALGCVCVGGGVTFCAEGGSPAVQSCVAEALARSGGLRVSRSRSDGVQQRDLHILDKRVNFSLTCT